MGERLAQITTVTVIKSSSNHQDIMLQAVWHFILAALHKSMSNKQLIVQRSVPRLAA